MHVLLSTTLGFFQQQNHQFQHLVLVACKTVTKNTPRASFLYKVSLLHVFQYNSEMLTSTLPTNTIACKDILTDLIPISKHTYLQV